MKTVVIGAGSLGVYFANRLVRSGGASSLTHLIQKRGSVLPSAPVVELRIAASDRVLPERVQSIADGFDNLKGSAPFDIVLVLVKFRDTPVVASELKRAFQRGFVTAESMVVSFQNGLGNLEILKKPFERESPVFIQGLTYVGVSRTSKMEAKVNGVGETFIGTTKDVKTQQKLEKLMMMFNSDPEFDDRYRMIQSDRIESLVWTKLLVNTLINPLTGLLNKENEVVLNEHYRNLIKRGADEFLAISEAEGIELELQGCSEPADFVLRVAKETEANISSMLADIRNRKMTEIDAINGQLVHLASKHGLDVPVLSSLFHLIKAIETRS